MERVQAERGGGGVGGSNECNFQGEVSLVCKRVYGVVELDRKQFFFLFFFLRMKRYLKDASKRELKLFKSETCRLVF